MRPYCNTVFQQRIAHLHIEDEYEKPKLIHCYIVIAFMVNRL